MDLTRLRERLAATPSLRPVGRVIGVVGLTVRLALPGARLGDVAIVRRQGQPILVEVVGFDGASVIAVALGDLAGVGPEDAVESTGGGLTVGVGPSLLGRVLDGLGRPIDGGPEPANLKQVPVRAAPPNALSRPLIDRVLVTGVRSIDGLLALGVGQRVGLFAGSGVGKSTLLGAIARGASVDVVVVALVGERGREVVEFLDHALGSHGRSRSVVVVATSDACALERLRAAEVATAVAEAFRDEGKNVMLLVDSITRVARAQREVGLAAGEPPARRGYPPSVFALLPRLLERTGRAALGSITAIYTVLVEGEDMDEPIADEVRGILDGHIVLSRTLAARGHYPAVDVVQSLSRVMSQITDAEQQSAAARVRQAIALYEEKRDLIVLGAYAKGGDPALDRAIAERPRVEAFLMQHAATLEPLEATRAALQRLARGSG
ncbi:MAG TPA: FliI/YscN family ATPase, partial [Polyangiaceae bacterium]|nr:FliI/YscN family ATPase [Polyangiaceae bacterium]